MDSDELTTRTSSVRDAAWSAWGTVDDDVLAHLINPMFMGGPAWPNIRQAFRVARRPREILLASDGLADPFHDRSAAGNGFGHEFYAVTSDPLEKIPGTWLWDMVWQMSQFAAGHGGLAALFEELSLLSTELYDVGIPDSHRDRFVTDQDRVGVLLGLRDATPPASIDGPLSPIRLINIKLLTVAELDHIVEHGEAGREEIAQRLVAQGRPLVSSLDRRSVV